MTVVAFTNLMPTLHLALNVLCFTVFYFISFMLYIGPIKAKRHFINRQTYLLYEAGDICTQLNVIIPTKIVSQSSLVQYSVSVTSTLL